MRRSVAKRIHQSTNVAYWVENPTWRSGNAAVDLFCKAVRLLPFSLYEAQKKLFFDPERLIGVSGESVVVANGLDKVDKFMFRYPGRMPLETFKKQVAYEVGAVTTCLSGIALPTEVSIKEAIIFRHTRLPVAVVTQTQPRLDLATHVALNLKELEAEKRSAKRDATIKCLAQLLQGVDRLAATYDFVPDVAYSSGNLRRSAIDGTLTLIDVMPVHSDDNRLIDDHPPKLLEHIQDNLQNYREFIAQEGA